MAFAPANLRCIGERFGPGRSGLWEYKSDDAHNPTVRAAGYIATAHEAGMEVGDRVTVIQTTAGAITAVTQAVVVAITSGAADLSDGTAISVANS